MASEDFGLFGQERRQIPCVMLWLGAADRETGGEPANREAPAVTAFDPFCAFAGAGDSHGCDRDDLVGNRADGKVATAGQPSRGDNQANLYSPGTGSGGTSIFMS
jgi:hypothetical protein